MRRSLTMRVWLPALTLATMVFWFGCEQKGDISPTGTSRNVLTFIDTVTIDPQILAPGGTATLEARILSEFNEPASGEDVRFTVSRGALAGARADTTIQSDSLGRARTTYTAPDDTGSVLVRTELLSMSELRTTTVLVSSTETPSGGLFSVWADFDTLLADNGISSTRIYARLRNVNHNPIGGATIYFSTTAGTISSPEVTDGVTGTATATLVSSTEVGTAVVIARYGTTTDTARVHFVAPAEAGQITLSASAPQIMAGTGTATITALVFDVSGLPVADNTLVFFATSRGTLTALTVHTIAGVATTTLLASPSTGQADITATTGNQVTGNTSVQIIPGPLAIIEVTAWADTLFANNSDTTSAIAFVADSYGNPVSEGTPILFTAVGGTVIGGSTVGPDGRAVTTFHAGLDAGPATIVAANGDVQGSVSIYLRPTPAVTIALSANPLILPADGTSQSDLRALVLDASGSPVSNGTSVTFVSETGLISGSGGANSRNGGNHAKNAGAWASALDQSRGSGRINSNRKLGGTTKHDFLTASTYTTTTMDGYASATLTSSTTAGTDEITATVGSLTDDQIVTYEAGEPAMIQITPANSEMPADGWSSTMVTCAVTDAFGNSVGSGLAISVSATLGTISPLNGYTDNSGMFTASLQSSRERGISAIVATVEGASGYGQVNFVAPEVTAVVLGTSQSSILADGISYATLMATALDEHSVPVSGESIQWQVSAGPGTLLPLSSITDSMGNASAIFYSGASEVDVNQTVTATISDHSDARMIHLVGVSISAWAEDDELPADGSSTTPINVQLRESSSGVAIPNATIRFAATSGSIPQTAQTDASGIAMATYRSSTVPGAVEISCLYGDTLRAQTALQLMDTEADTVIAAVAQNELTADGISSTIVTAVVYNEGMEIVPNTPVTFTVNGAGYFFPTVMNTNENGIAISTYHSAALSQDQEVTLNVAIDRTEENKAVMLRGVSMVATSSVSALPANGTSTTDVRVELRFASTLVAIPNATVQFGTDLGTIASSASTDSSGVALVTFTAGTDPGDASIIARYGNLLTDTVSVELFSPSASTVTAMAASTSLLANGESTTLLTTVITDQMGAPIAGANVSWTLNGPGNLANTVTVTNAAGVSTNLFTSSASISDQSSEIVVAAGTGTDMLTIESRGVTLTLTVEDDLMPANGFSTTDVSAQLRETTSLVAIMDEEVNFGTSLGSIVGSMPTDESGMAVVEFMTGTIAGTATIISQYGNMLSDTATLQLYVPSAQTINLSPGQSSIRADGMSTMNATATVLDEAGVPLGNAPVSWAVTTGTIQFAQTMTSSSGQATMTYQSAATMSDVPVDLSVTCGLVMQSTTVLARGVSVNVTATPEIVIADGNSTSEIRAHIYETTSNIAVSGEAVSFGATLGTIPNSSLTDESGLATVLLTSATQTGTSNVTASFGAGLSDDVQVTFAPSTPTTLTLTASPTVLLADNVSTSTLTAVVTDQNGNPVPNGTQVRFNLPPQSGSLENLRTTQGGVAANVLTSSSTPSTVVITAWSESNPSARDSVTVTYIVGPPSVVTMTAQSDTLQANGIAIDSVTAHVTDAVGHSLSNVEVLFTASVGNITASRVTNADGDARVAFTSPQTGTALITANASGAVGTYTIYLIPGNPNSIQMEYFPSSVGVRGSGRNETLLITATIRDANNNPVVDGTPVVFNINNSPGGGDFLSSTGEIPTINGQASVSYNSGTVSGSVRIRATCDGVTAVSTEILIHAGPPYIEDITLGCATSHMSLASSPCNMFGMDYVGDSVMVVALVGDRYNNPVTPGTAVYFTTSAGVITTSTGYTDSAGFARVTLYSGNPLPTIDRWYNTLTDPNIGGAILCSTPPTQAGMAKVLVSSAGVDEAGDSVIVWATTDVIFDYSAPYLAIREATVNGDPDERELFIGENALITLATFDPDYWPLVFGSTITFSSSKGNVYPNEITIGCPGDTSYTVSFFNNLSLSDDDAATPVLISVDTRQGDAFAFTETFTLRAALPEGP